MFDVRLEETIVIAKIYKMNIRSDEIESNE